MLRIAGKTAEKKKKTVYLHVGQDDPPSTFGTINPESYEKM